MNVEAIVHNTIRD